jgi:hypothetical protein
MGRPSMTAKGQLKKVDKAVEKMAKARLWFNLKIREKLSIKEDKIKGQKINFFDKNRISRVCFKGRCNL